MYFIIWIKANLPLLRIRCPLLSVSSVMQMSWPFNWDMLGPAQFLVFWQRGSRDTVLTALRKLVPKRVRSREGVECMGEQMHKEVGNLPVFPWKGKRQKLGACKIRLLLAIDDRSTPQSGMVPKPC